MPLPLPNLDDRRWADLVEESRSLIPRFAPSWTDHNVHDPGITLMELFAWLAEMSIYRLSQVPERHLRKFLSLIGVIPRPPHPAQALLKFEPDSGTAPFTLPAGTVFEANQGTKGTVPFYLRRDLTVVTSKLAAFQVESDTGIRDRWRILRAGSPIAPFGSNPRTGAAFYLGFDENLPHGKSISLGFRFAVDKTDIEERLRILEEVVAQEWAYRQLRPGTPCDLWGRTWGNVDGTPLPPHHSVRLTWEFFAADGGGSWQALVPESGQVMDDTRTLTLDGTLRFVLPSAMKAVALGEAEKELYYLRCRLAHGAYDYAPRIAEVGLNSVEVEQATPAWQRFPIAAGSVVNGPLPTSGDVTRLTFTLDATGTITELTFNPNAQTWPHVRVLSYGGPTVTDPGAIALELVHLDEGTGETWQKLNLTPIVAGSTQLFTLAEASGNLQWQAWERCTDFDSSQRTDLHYTLDPTNGEIVFGDGQRGCTPKSGSPVLAIYQITQTTQGNLPKNTILELADTPLNPPVLAMLPPNTLSQLTRIASLLGPATSGAAAETTYQAIGRAVEILWAHERLQTLCEQYGCKTLDQIPDPAVLAVAPPTRAVNELDFERLALSVPGTRVKRAYALSNFHPDYPQREAPGVVSVAIVPELPDTRPRPSRGLRRAVYCYLEWRRLVTTQIKVVGPRYVEVRVRAEVQPCEGVDRNKLRTAIIAALDQFMDPLEGGPNGEGWPFGRDVYRSEILQVIDDVPGVDYVVRLTLFSNPGGTVSGNLSVGPLYLVTPGKHDIEVVGYEC